LILLHFHKKELPDIYTQCKNTVTLSFDGVSVFDCSIFNYSTKNHIPSSFWNIANW